MQPQAEGTPSRLPEAGDPASRCAPGPGRARGPQTFSLPTESPRGVTQAQGTQACQ